MILITLSELAFLVPVKMNPESSDPQFIFSKNWTTGTSEWKTTSPSDKKMKNSDNWSIWASDGILSGKKYWEVSVSLGSVWSVGVSERQVPMNRWTRLSPSEGCWMLMLWNIDDSAAQMRTFGTSTLMIPLSNIGIYLDFEGGRLSFYNSNDGAHLHTFSCKFTDKVFPVFKLWVSTEASSYISIV